MLTIDERRPYHRISDTEWNNLPVERFPITDLVLSQKHVTTASLLHGMFYQIGDEYPVLIALRWIDNRYQVHDGQHRVLVALARGETHINAKVSRKTLSL